MCERPSCHGTVDQIRQRFTYGSTGVANNLDLTELQVRANNGTLTAATDYEYDAVGNLTEINPELNGTNDRTIFIYDDARQRVGVIGPDPDAGGPLTHGAQRTTYNDWGQPTEVEFGTVSSYTNWAGFSLIDRQTVTYDSAGRMTQARLIEGSTTHALMQYSYDSAGRVDCVAQRMNPSTFASPPSSACTAATAGTYGPDRITRTTYDALNRRADVTTAYGTSAAITEAAWSYTDNGQVETLTDGEGNMYTYVYDAFDRLYQRRYPSPTTAGNSSTSDYEQFTYDAYGRLDTRRTRSGGTFSYDYDNLNRVTDVTAPGSTANTSYTYDNHGRILTVSDGSQTITNTYNGRGWLATQASANGTVSYEYDVLGRRTRMDWPDSYYVTYTYNQGGQLTSIRENGASSGAGRLADFTYDQHGRRILLERGNGVDTDYAYDAASRLEELVHDLNGTSHDRTLEFSYNPAGQITSRTDSNTTYAWTDFVNFTENSTHNGLNQILSVTGQSIAPDYDDRGNLIQDHNNQTYGYDEYNRLTDVGSTIELAYDPFGRLAETSGTGVTFREFLYDGINLIAEYNGSGTLQRRYVHGPGTDEPLVEYTSASTSSRTWLMADERGSIVAITNGSGNATQVNTYDEYGDPGSSNAGRFGYTGQMWLPETGLYHYKARAYNPELGRFMQTDPIGVNGGMNIYAYVGGDPVNFTDPLGLDKTCTGSRISRPDDYDCSRTGGRSECYGNCSAYYGRQFGSFAGGAGGSWSVCENSQTTNGSACRTGVFASNASSLFPAVSLAAALEGWALRGFLASGALLADDVTVIGVADDVAIPPILIASAAAASTAIVIRAVHANSLRSTRPTHVYQIVSNRSGEILKYGITSSANPERRYPAWVLRVGNARMELIATHSNRLSARTHEYTLCESFHAMHGRRPYWSVVC
jgi:RHS repeat-associated protein